MLDADDTAELLPTGEVARRLRMGGKLQTVWRWQVAGVLIAGIRVYLGCVRIGRNRYSTQEQIDAFLAACNAGADPVVSESAATRRRRDEAGQRRLREKLRRGR